MRILDLNSQEEVSDTKIGQELQLTIELKPPNGNVNLNLAPKTGLLIGNRYSYYRLLSNPPYNASFHWSVYDPIRLLSANFKFQVLTIYGRDIWWR